MTASYLSVAVPAKALTPYGEVGLLEAASVVKTETEVEAMIPAGAVDFQIDLDLSTVKAFRFGGSVTVQIVANSTKILVTNSGEAAANFFARAG